MSQELEELPLFPLNTVLFPYAQLQIHVFEDRYREMVRECLEFDKPFGIVLIRSGSETGGHADPYLVGTVVRIIGCHNYDDGRMDVQVQGERRFRIREIDESRAFLVGKVEPVVELEVEDDPETTDLQSRARQDCEILVQRRFENQGFSVKVVFPQDPVALSFTIANLLTMENLEKQKLLETTDTCERFQYLIPILEMQMLEAPNTGYFRLSPADLQDWIVPN